MHCSRGSNGSHEQLLSSKRFFLSLVVSASLHILHLALLLSYSNVLLLLSDQAAFVDTALISCLQITLGVFLSMAYGAYNAHTSMGILAMLRLIHSSGNVPATANMDLLLLCVSTAAMAVGSMLLGKRLVPVTGQ